MIVLDRPVTTIAPAALAPQDYVYAYAQPRLDKTLSGTWSPSPSYSYTDSCRYLGGYQRVDIEVVQDRLATFGIIPAT